MILYSFWLAFIFGSLGTLAFSPYDIWITAILSITGLLLIISNYTHKKASLFGFIWGCGLFGTGINWIYVSLEKFSTFPIWMNIILMIGLIIYLSLYPMLFSALLIKFWPLKNLYHFILAAPTLWILIELLRGYVFTGFPWLEFGYSQIDSPLKCIAPIFGVHYVTLLIVMIGGLAAFSIKYYKLIPMIIILLIFLILYTIQPLNWYYDQPHRSINITLIQGNIDQVIKWNTQYINTILNTYLYYTLLYFEKTQIIVWPESAIPDNEISQRKFLIQLDTKLRKNKTHLITGIIGVRASELSCYYNYYNTILVLGNSVPYEFFYKNRYDKHHLVPFGEKIPCKKFLYSLVSKHNISMISLHSGEYLQPQLQVNEIKITPTICYEVILGHQVRDNFKSDTDFLLTLSNNAWFGKTIGTHQFFQMARMRSLELGRPLLHSSNTGITAIINANGTIKIQLLPFICGVLNTCVAPTRGMTPYVYWGYYPLWISIIIFIYILLKFQTTDYSSDIINYLKT